MMIDIVMRSAVSEQSILGSTLIFLRCNGGEEVRSWQKSSLGLVPRGVSPWIDEGKQVPDILVTHFCLKMLTLPHEFRCFTWWNQAHCFVLQTISQSKLKSFSIGMMNAGLKKPVKSKQEAEEKKKVSIRCHFIVVIFTIMRSMM